MAMFDDLRRPLKEIVELPSRPVDTITLDAHVWKEEEGKKQRSKGSAEYDLEIVDSFVPTPEIRDFVAEVFNKVVNKEGQGWWIQSEFGSGKSHLLAFLTIMLTCESDEPWDILDRTERERENRGKNESLAQSHFRDIKSMSVFPIVCSLVGKGGREVGSDREGKPLIDYVVEAAQAAYEDYWGQPLHAFPSELVADHFRNGLSSGRRSDFNEFLARTEADAGGPATYEQWEELATADARGAGDIIRAFYKDQGVKPDIPVDAEGVLRRLVDAILECGFDGIAVVLDEVSEFLLRSEDVSSDEDCLLYLSEQLTRTHKKPVWTFCAAQSKLETTARKIISENRLKEQNLLISPLSYYDIILKRTRRVVDAVKCDAHFDYHRDRFSWVKELGSSPDAKEFARVYHQSENLDGDELARRFFAYLFPYHPEGLLTTKAVSFKLTTTRAGIVVLYDALKHQLELPEPADREMVTPDRVFDQFESLSDGSNAVRSKFPGEYEAYERARNKIESSTALSRARYKDDQPLRCLKVLMMAFLEDVDSPRHLTAAHVADSVMVTRQQEANAQDNKDFFEVLLGRMASEIPQIKSSIEPAEFWFDPSIGAIDPAELFERFKHEIADDPKVQDQYWDKFLGLDGLSVKRPNGAMREFAPGLKCDFADMANAEKNAYTVPKQVLWRGRWVKGACRLGDLNKVLSLQPIKTAETDEDFVVLVSRRPSHSNLNGTLDTKPDPRYVLWEPADLNDAQRDSLCEWGAYNRMIDRYKDRDSEEAETVLKWVAERLPGFVPQMMSAVVAAYGAGRIGSANVRQHSFSYTGASQFDTVVTKAVGDVLDIVYKSSDIRFTGSQSLGDDEATLVANSLIRYGEVKSSSGKEDKYTSAATNFGRGLQLVKDSNATRLNLEGCKYAAKISEFIAAKSDTTLPMTLFYNNFMGIDASTGKGEGLSRRLVQLYVLALVRDGELKATLKSGTLPDATEIDYSNIGQVNFNAAVMSGMINVSVVQAPGDWNIVRPLIAVILDKEIPETKDEKQIKQHVEEFETVYSEHAGVAGRRQGELDGFFLRVGQPNGYTEFVDYWVRFFSSATTGSVEQRLSAIKNALTDIFGFDLTGSSPKPLELGEFRKSWEKYSGVCAFLAGYSVRAEVGFAYIAEQIPEGEQMKSVIKGTGKLRGLLMQQLSPIIEKPAFAESDFVPAYETVLERYFDVYKAIHAGYYQAAAKARKELESLPSGNEANAVSLLDEVESLGSLAWTLLGAGITAAATRMPDCDVQDQASLKAHLADKPTCKCLLHLSEAEAGIKSFEGKVTSAQAGINGAVIAKADVLVSDSVRSRIKKANEKLKDKRLAAIVAEDSSRKLAAYLVAELAKSRELVDLLKEILKDVVVVDVPWNSLRPGKQTLEESDIQDVADDLAARLRAEFDKAAEAGAKVIVQLSGEAPADGGSE